MRIQRTLGRFPSPTPCWFLVRMYLCGYVAFSARAPAQHCWMCCANERNIVGPRFDDRETIEMLALVGSEVWPVSNFIQQLPTSRNNTQHGVQTLATCWAQQCCVLLVNNVANVCTGLYITATNDSVTIGRSSIAFTPSVFEICAISLPFVVNSVRKCLL